jgi:glycosyltransferase involved in cell wall biosynthesis
MVSVSLAFPCWNRGKLLDRTLRSIKRQNYPEKYLELVVVEDGDDGITAGVAHSHGAEYIRRERTESYPIFQNIASHWNLCLKVCHNEIAILQTAEVMHESEHVIEELVKHIGNRKKVLATALVADLAPDGSFAGWYNHPREGSRPGWISGSGPHAFRREEMLEIGGYTELFYGYGHEDDELFFRLRKDGWSIEYVESAVCAHQWHERTKFEPVTGYANRSLIRTLTMEIEDGKRSLVANKEPFQFDAAIEEEQITGAVLAALNSFPMSRTFKTWAVDCWLAGNKHPDMTFVYQRDIANEGMGKVSEIGEMITEAAWAFIRAHEAYHVADTARCDGKLAWAARAERCGDIDATWASRALARAHRLMEER